MKLFPVLTIFVVVVFSCSAKAMSTAEELIQTGRYTVIKNQVASDQANPLKVVVGTRLPQSVVTIEDAVKISPIAKWL